MDATDARAKVASRAGYHVLCANRQHPGGWCKEYGTLAEANAGLAKHRKDTGHEDNGRSAGKCPIAPEP